MANIYLRSTDGNNGDSGATWALAKASLVAGPGAIDAAGDTIWVSQVHNETTVAGTQTLLLSGTSANPIRILCGNDSAEPPTALATGGTFNLQGTSITIAVTGSFYAYGITVKVGTGANSPILSLGGGSQESAVFENCAFEIVGTGATGRIFMVGQQGCAGIYKNCTVKFAAAGQGLDLFGGNQSLIQGLALAAGGTSPTNFVYVSGNGGKVVLENLDLTNASAGINLISSVGSAGANIVFRNCKLPASWSGALCIGTLALLERHELYNADASATNYRLWIATGVGDITSETTLVRTGGASDGVTALSWKFVSGANAKWYAPLSSPEIVVWNTSIGSSITATVEILHDSVTNLKDSEVWLEVNYLSASGTPIGTLITDKSADVLAAGTNQTTSSEAWTTSGMGNPNKQNLSVTFTPQMKGFIHAVVKVAKASYTLYVDPLLTIA